MNGILRLVVAVYFSRSTDARDSLGTFTSSGNIPDAAMTRSKNIRGFSSLLLILFA